MCLYLLTNASVGNAVDYYFPARSGGHCEPVAANGDAVNRIHVSFKRSNFASVPQRELLYFLSTNNKQRLPVWRERNGAHDVCTGKREQKLAG